MRFSIIREPLVHFGVLGTLLFVLYARMAPAKADPNTISVSRDELASLAAQFERTRQRRPTTEELGGLVESYVHDEILYREGLALGLDRDDAIVKNRVRQKLAVLSEEALAAEPSDAELARYLAENRERFELPATVSFEQVYFDPERHEGRLDGDIRRTLALLRGRATPASSGSASRAVDAVHGDPPSIDFTTLPASLTNASPEDVTRAFGVAFEQGIRALATGTWAGPVPSAFGMHLVRIAARGAPHLPALAEIREQVAREWQHARATTAKEREYRALRARYAVSIAAGPPSVAADHP